MRTVNNLERAKVTLPKQARFFRSFVEETSTGTGTRLGRRYNTIQYNTILSYSFFPTANYSVCMALLSYIPSYVLARKYFACVPVGCRSFKDLYLFRCYSVRTVRTITATL